MIETLDIEFKDIGGAIGWAEFAAQKHYNNTGNGYKKVTKAVVSTDGKLVVEYIDTRPKDPVKKPERQKKPQKVEL